MSPHRSVPVFVVHLGCPHACIFCDQKAITQSRFSPEGVLPFLEEAFAKAENRGAQIAFFGGSFTAVERSLMLRLLQIAQGFVERSLASSIRFSTRPDAMGDEVISLLKDFAVSDVELGIQSTDDRVLRAAQRGHSAKDAFLAAERIRKAGWHLTGQMMLGLPRSTLLSEMQTARDLCAMGAENARVYPTVVFDGTPLGEMLRGREYIPLSEEDAVERGAAVCRVLLKNGVKLIRVGLCDNAELHSSRVLGGANLAAYGERVYSRLYAQALRRELSPLAEEIRGRELTLLASPGTLSRLSGYRKENKRLLFSLFSPSRLTLRGDEEAAEFEIHYQIGEEPHRKKGNLNVLKNT